MCWHGCSLKHRKGTDMRIKLTITLAMAILSATPAQADDKWRAPSSPEYRDECGSCHIAFPPQMLDAASWRALMDGLNKHFGSDASVDDKRRLAIADFLQQNAARRSTQNAKGKPLLRISETAHFVKEHREIDAATWRRPSIKTAANCGACHKQAAAGDFGEHSIAIPR